MWWYIVIASPGLISLTKWARKIAEPSRPLIWQRVNFDLPNFKLTVQQDDWTHSLWLWDKVSEVYSGPRPRPMISECENDVVTLYNMFIFNSLICVFSFPWPMIVTTDIRF
jgi:hypothetical protein